MAGSYFSFCNKYAYTDTELDLTGINAGNLIVAGLQGVAIRYYRGYV